MIYKDQKHQASEVDPMDRSRPVDGPIFKDAAPCFTSGTKIIALGGEKNVEDITVGDRILTADHGFQPVRWVGRRHVSASELAIYPQLRPYVIKKGAFGNQRDLRVSPQHGMARRIGGNETLLRAKNVGEVIGSECAHLDMQCRDVDYFHIMFDQHELVFAEGAMTEAYFPGPSAIGSLDHDAREELLLLFPELRDIWTSTKPASVVFGQPARSYHEATVHQIAA